MNPTGARRDAEDQRFLDAFDSGALSPRDFHHREHLRLAWLCVTQSGPEAAMEEFPRRLRAFLARHRVDPAKYHETVTIGWLLLVGARVSTEPAAPSFASFATRHPDLLTSDLLFAHYSRARLLSAEARSAFIPPDLAPLPGAGH
ncbi:MAG: hypothetical protein RIS54_1572 [Verrucomicrobiota bacterium]|jgi:hypothetical protein